MRRELQIPPSCPVVPFLSLFYFTDHVGWVVGTLTPVKVFLLEALVPVGVDFSHKFEPRKTLYR